MVLGKRRLATGVLVAAGLLFVGRKTYTCLNPPSSRLANQLRPGMALAEVRARATDLGFTWAVDEVRLKETGRTSCHEADGLVCGDGGGGWGRASYACIIVVKEGVVDHAWFYMD